MKYRKEKDSLGTVTVPEDAYYGASTQRAINNFPISGLRFSRSFIFSLAMIKKCAAMVNGELGLLDEKISKSIVASAQEIMEGKFDTQFPVDVFQTGSGTSTNMNMNEVIASRANETITGEKGGKIPVHPNDHVNLGQSSNDVIPSALHISALTRIKGRLVPALLRLKKSLLHKTSEMGDVKKIGRTHLQDAVPIFLGQEFSGYARQVALGIKRIEAVEDRLAELALGGTAVGNGLNTHPDFAKKVVALISKYSNLNFTEAENHFEAQGAQDAAVETSGALKTIAVSLVKICNDIRWLASGPRCGLGEISIPSVQPGSSIMPGKINPVIPEAVIQAAVQVMGNDTTIMIGGQAGNFELNVMLPVIAYNLLQSIDLLSSGADVLAEKCIDGIGANRGNCAGNIEKSLALATYLVPHIGYDRAAAIANKAHETGKTIIQVASEEEILSEKELKKIFNGLKID
ncbi:MAG: class II fumarate hydratase [Deltaproteobacteria bacterium]|nr:class II fumarate hydratase [Deltaproteobacteria bacterium]MBW2196921.1 class II fumarate hydratase [Deltaproteobacteria bacterium]MBW2226597.1 class II fumarate hydratase [Deltaproteobacteria bacterium]MBW2326046.1 class II fumarate hydratase [Deltaproteobacteria bacterium]